ncbi:MAG: hypothetical protein OQK75_02840 [Gammaproteobacteria bacterium]|nr:hypothetical protein [Gammaproteobacteria bacterium]MCW8986585.1 hypothetical protein [Gammaproteobacteria bacterium]MCW9032501.1 hypothetical protein [Gammaproteobacteria bacterium]
MSLEIKDTIRKAEELDDKPNSNESADKYKVKSNFNVMSIEKTETPEGMGGDNWYQYIIGKGSSEIQGLKMGSLKEVTAHANNVANDLNDRSKGIKTSTNMNKKKPTPPPA